MAAGNIYTVTVVQKVNDNRFANVLHFRQESGTDTPDPRADLLELIEDGLIPVMVPALSVQWVPVCAHVRRVGLAGQDYFRRIFAAETGDIAGEALPSDVAAVLALYTSTLGRGGIGRQFLSGIAQSSEEDNCLNQAAFDLCEVIGEWLGQNQAGTTYTWRAGLLKPGPTFAPFTDWETRTALTVVKSRKPSFAC